MMEVSDLVRSLLEKRGITAAEDVSRFLTPDYERDTHDPFLLADMERAVSRLLLAIAQGERIAVYADFDCDGIPGAALLKDLFDKIGYANVSVYIPHRDREGYGFHPAAIEQLAGDGVSLIITVDVGTVAFEGVDYAKEKGIDVIVTDHHELKEALPAAFAVVNPMRAPYPFPHLCGAAVAWKLAQATLVEGRRRGLPAFTAIPEGWEKWLLDLVAIATVADMMPLVGENRALVHFGLKVLRQARRPGIAALLLKQRARPAELTEDDIGFLIAPRINAASRMDEPDLAFALLTTNDRAEASAIAAKLEKLNASRKGVVAGIVRQARTRMRARFTDESNVVVLGDPAWKPALLGLAANSLMNERGGAVCLWGKDANGTLKGSCRSDGSIALPALFAAASDALQEYGGHEKSGGFSLAPEHVHTLPDILSDAAAALVRASAHGGASRSAPAPDARLGLADISRALFADIATIGPFGIENPKPIFRVDGCIVTSVRRFGKGSDHVELSLECRASGARARAFDFFRAPEGFTQPPAQGAEACVLATIERDTFRGGLALRLVDIIPTSRGEVL